MLVNRHTMEVQNAPFRAEITGVPGKECLIALKQPSMCGVPAVKGKESALPVEVRKFVKQAVLLFKPANVYICDGSKAEQEYLCNLLVKNGQLMKLDKYDNCYLTRTDPADVARVEGKTFISTPNKIDAVPIPREGVKGILGQWAEPEQTRTLLANRMQGCMAGRTMYVIPFSMGPIGGPLSKVGVQLTDFEYVALSQQIMTRSSSEIWGLIEEEHDFVKCVHSIGAPYPLKRKLMNNWPCDPEQVIIAHFPLQREIMSYGSGYGGNALLGKKCFALRIASTIARDEGWLAEHMLIIGVTNPDGVKKYFAGAFPSACGKTNMAMMLPTLPGWKVECVGDDIAWMRFDEDGQLRAINPEAGFFGVAPGTSMRTNPIAMETIRSNTIFTNVASTSDGGFFWEGLEKEVPSEVEITNWLGKPWSRTNDRAAGPAAHPNSRFCVSAGQCPVIDPEWESGEGVPISGIIFGGRRPEGIPLVYESFSWKHGVMVGATMKSEATAAAEHKQKTMMHDPMAMRPFLGYNFCHYLQHWLDLEKENRTMPKIFHVNWFRKNAQGGFLWPGFGENIRVVKWMFDRCDNKQDIATATPIGLMPVAGSIDIAGLGEVDMEALMDLPKEFLLEDIAESKQFLDDQTSETLPPEIYKQLNEQEKRINNM